MRRVFVLFVLACIVVVTAMSVVTTAGASSGMLMSTHDAYDPTPAGPPDFESAERLLLPPTTTTVGDASVSVDPGHVMSSSFTKLQVHYELGTLQAEVDAAEDPDQALDLVRGNVEDFERSVDATIEAEREAYEAYAAGERSSEEFVADFGLLHDRSAILEEQADMYVNVVRGLPTRTNQEQITRLRGELSQLKHEVTGLQGPVKADIAADLAGEHSSRTLVYLRSTPDGYVVATTDGGVFTREVFVAENRDRERGSNFTDIETAREQTEALYPWTFENSIGTDSILRGGIYWVRVAHPHGTTTTYLDSGTELPFREIQETNLAAIPTFEVTSEIESGIVLTIDRTYAGGPAHIMVTDPDTGEPISNAAISVDDRYMKTTGDDGSAWIVTPDNRFVVRATLEDRAVSARIWIPTVSR